LRGFGCGRDGVPIAEIAGQRTRQ
jgi:hypothetical protein